MRPVNRGPAPRTYDKYEKAKQDLVNQLGSYCSYCERRISTHLAVEHIQPKGLPQYEHLKNEWTNFLLACVNCNSSKSDRLVELDKILLPDRDNTFAAFVYHENGSVDITPDIGEEIQALATATRDLTALNKVNHQNWDETALFSALERVGQRVQAWVQAKEALQDYKMQRTLPRPIAREAAGAGFFSIWMAAFDGIQEVRSEIIRVFPNTAEDCFDEATNPVSPRPANELPHGGKI